MGLLESLVLTNDLDIHVAILSYSDKLPNGDRVSCLDNNAR
jgi:hypothetical protein